MPAIAAAKERITTSRPRRLTLWNRALKRSIDLAGALVLLVFSAPLICILALRIKLHDGGPVLFRRRVVGQRGEFDAFKIVMGMNVPTGPKGKGTAVRTNTYYYSPEIKAIVSYREIGTEAGLVLTLVDFNVGN